MAEVIETCYDNGKLGESTMYDELTGLCEFWYENGQLRKSAMYKDGVKQ